MTTHNHAGLDCMREATTLRCAALILQDHSTKPKSFMLRVLVKLLHDTADGIDRKAKASAIPWPENVTTPTCDRCGSDMTIELRDRNLQPVGGSRVVRLAAVCQSCKAET